MNAETRSGVLTAMRKGSSASAWRYDLSVGFEIEASLIDTPAAAVYLGVTPRHIRRLITSGKLRAWRRNQSCFVAVDDLRQLVNRREVLRSAEVDPVARHLARKYAPRVGA